MHVLFISMYLSAYAPKWVFWKVTVDRGHRFPAQIKQFPQREPPILLETNTGCPWWTRCYYLASQPQRKKLEGVELLAGLWAPSAWNNATTKISGAKRGSLLQFKRLLFSLLLILSFLVIKTCRGREGLGTVEQCDWLSKGLRKQTVSSEKGRSDEVHRRHSVNKGRNHREPLRNKTSTLWNDGA